MAPHSHTSAAARGPAASGADLNLWGQPKKRIMRCRKLLLRWKNGGKTPARVSVRRAVRRALHPPRSAVAVSSLPTGARYRRTRSEEDSAAPFPLPVTPPKEAQVLKASGTQLDKKHGNFRFLPPPVAERTYDEPLSLRGDQTSAKFFGQHSMGVNDESAHFLLSTRLPAEPSRGSNPGSSYERIRN